MNDCLTCAGYRHDINTHTQFMRELRKLNDMNGVEIERKQVNAIVIMRARHRIEHEMVAE